MLQARIVGNATMAVCHPGLNGCKMLLCEVLDATTGQGTGKIVVASDWVGAGIGMNVLITADGGAFQLHVDNPKAPMRNVIMGIIDEKQEKAI